MNRKAFVVIDIQNDITKHYRDIIDKTERRYRMGGGKRHYKNVWYGKRHG